MSATLRSDFDLSKVGANAVKASCKCQFWQDCNWSNTEVINISELPSGSTNWKAKVNFFKARICNKKERTVFCCGNNGEFPRDSELKILKKEKSNNVRNLVTWHIDYMFWLCLLQALHIEYHILRLLW